MYIQLTASYLHLIEQSDRYEQGSVYFIEQTVAHAA